jgi:hypothetical protein
MRAAAFSLVRNAAAAESQSAEFAIGGLAGSEAQVRQLGLWRELLRDAVNPR